MHPINKRPGAGLGVLGLLILMTALPACGPAAEPESGQDIRAFETGLSAFGQEPAPANASPKFLSLAERMAHYQVPGASIAVVNGGKIAWAKGYGEIKAGSGIPVTTDTLFEAASTTKALVSAVVLHYAAEGRLDLDADVNTYLKSWKVPDNEFTQREKVTLRRLLSHRAGLPQTDMGYDDKAGIPSLVQVVKGEFPAQNKAAVPESLPGSEWRYSNVGYVLIQLVLEDALGRPLESIMSEILFKPLGMESTTLTYPLPPAWRDREAMPHDKDGRPAEPGMHPTAQAQGGLMTTPSDLARFLMELLQAYRGESQRVLTRDMAQAMFRAEAELDPKMFGMPMSDGLGMFLKGQGPSLIVLHPGNNYPGSVCWLIGYPERGQGAIVCLNGAGGELLALEILASLGRVYGWPPLM